MFDGPVILGGDDRGIVVETHKGTRIANCIAAHPTEDRIQRYRGFLNKFGEHWQERRSATGIYNCAGHVWASRRTSIYEDEAWRKILEDDAYRLLPAGEPPAPGDLVLYVDEEEKFIHVARVVALEPPVGEGGSPIPRVISKWNDSFGEVIHRAPDVPYARIGYDCRIEIWTDR